MEKSKETAQKIVLITGGSSGIGEGAVLKFADSGYQVITTSRKPAKVTQFDDLKNIEVWALDLADEKSIRDLAQKIEKQFGRLDVLVNNAGFGIIGAVETCSMEDIRSQFEANFFGTVHLTQELLPLFRKQNSGTIMTVTSIGGKMVFPYFGIYNATKHALEAVQESLWLELFSTNIRIKTFEPGFTQTKFATSGMRRGSKEIDFYQKTIEALEKTLEEGNSGTPPAKIGEAIYKAVHDGKNDLRYHAGRLATPLLLLRKFLPGKWFRKLVLTQIKT